MDGGRLLGNVSKGEAMKDEHMKTISDMDQASEVVVASLPRHRGRMFAAYMENGFTRDEAFALIVEEMWAGQTGECQDEDSM